MSVNTIRCPPQSKSGKFIIVFLFSFEPTVRGHGPAAEQGGRERGEAVQQPGAGAGPGAERGRTGTDGTRAPVHNPHPQDIPRLPLLRREANEQQHRREPDRHGQKAERSGGQRFDQSTLGDHDHGTVLRHTVGHGAAEDTLEHLMRVNVCVGPGPYLCNCVGRFAIVLLSFHAFLFIL